MHRNLWASIGIQPKLAPCKGLCGSVHAKTGDCGCTDEVCGCGCRFNAVPEFFQRTQHFTSKQHQAWLEPAPPPPQGVQTAITNFVAVAFRSEGPCVRVGCVDGKPCRPCADLDFNTKLRTYLPHYHRAVVVCTAKEKKLIAIEQYLCVWRRKTRTNRVPRRHGQPTRHPPVTLSCDGPCRREQPFYTALPRQGVWAPTTTIALVRR